MSLIIVLTNVSNLAPVSDYKYAVLVGDGTIEKSQTLAAGMVRGHARHDGWQTLVRRLLEESTEEMRTS